MRGEKWGGAWYAWNIEKFDVYSDSGCKNKIDMKACYEDKTCEAIGSSWHKGTDYYSPKAAMGVVGGKFGGRVDPQQHPTLGRVVWIGVAFTHKNIEVKCATIENNEANRIEVDKLVGSEWVEVKQQDVKPKSKVTIRV